MFRVMSRFRPAVDRLAAYVPGEQPPDGAGIVKLNTNENPYPPSPGALAALDSRRPGGAAALSPSAGRRVPAQRRGGARRRAGVDSRGQRQRRPADDALSRRHGRRTARRVSGADLRPVPHAGRHPGRSGPGNPVRRGVHPAGGCAGGRRRDPDPGRQPQQPVRHSGDDGPARDAGGPHDRGARDRRGLRGVRRRVGPRPRAPPRPRHRAAHAVQEPRPRRAATRLRHRPPGPALRPVPRQGQLQRRRRRGGGGCGGHPRRCPYTRETVERIRATRTRLSAKRSPPGASASGRARPTSCWPAPRTAMPAACTRA